MIALIVLAIRVLTALVTAAVYAGRDSSGGLSSVAVLASYRASDSALAVVLTVAVAGCVLTDRTRHARTLTLAAIVGLGISALVALTFAIIALGSRDGVFLLDTLDLVTYLAVPAICLVVLIKMLSLQPATSAAAQPYALPAGQPAESDSLALPAPSPHYQPTWQPDVAAGAAWQTAGDAAAGAPASGWGTPGQQGGWQYPPPAPQPPTIPIGGDPETRPT